MKTFLCLIGLLVLCACAENVPQPMPEAVTEAVTVTKQTTCSDDSSGADLACEQMHDKPNSKDKWVENKDGKGKAYGKVVQFEFTFLSKNDDSTETKNNTSIAAKSSEGCDEKCRREKAQGTFGIVFDKDLSIVHCRGVTNDFFDNFVPAAERYFTQDFDARAKKRSRVFIKYMQANMASYESCSRYVSYLNAESEVEPDRQLQYLHYSLFNTLDPILTDLKLVYSYSDISKSYAGYGGTLEEKINRFLTHKAKLDAYVGPSQR